MAAAAILDFKNFKFLTVGRVTSDELRHCAKVFGAHFPQMMSLIVLTPKRTILGRNHVI